MTAATPLRAGATNTPPSNMHQIASGSRNMPSASDLGAGPDYGTLKPATGVHSGAVATALAAYGWFIVAAWIAFARGYAALDLTVVVLISVALLGLLVGGAAMSRNMTPDRQTTRTFVEFINGDVDTETGRLNGWAAFVQIAVMPILLAIGGTVIAAIYLIVAR